MTGLANIPDMITKIEAVPNVPGIKTIFCNDERFCFLDTKEGKRYP